MDESIEPVIAVLGHPIAGIPIQFALERALLALELSWRVVSLEVATVDLPVALSGARVMGLHGLWIDRSLSRQAQDWARSESNPIQTAQAPQPLRQNVVWLLDRIDCFYRPRSTGDATAGSFVAASQELRWLGDTIDHHFATLGRTPQHWMTLGSGAGRTAATPDLDKVAQADVILLAPPDGRPRRGKGLAADRWPANDGHTLVIDFGNEDHPDLGILSDHGYRVLGSNQRLVGGLSAAIKDWTGCDVAADLLLDAVEEYLAV